jgi:phage terminase large subunit-like protein
MKARTPPTASSPDRTLAYATAVVAGEIVAGPHVRNACKRHIADLKRKDGVWFDQDAANHAFAFFEEVLKLSEGQFEGEPFELQPSQAFIVGSLFGWKRKDGRRRFRRAYIEQGKGNGKSPVAGGIGIYGMTACKEAGAQIYAAAAKKEQANILFRDAVRMVRQSPALARRLEFSGGPGREFNIAHLSSGSFFRPVSRDTGKTGSGPRPYFVLADEVHELPDRSIIEMLERGFKFRRDPLLFMITNSGSDRNSVAWEEHEHAIRVAAGNPDAVTDPTFLGQVIDDTTFSYVCALDEGDDPLSDPSCWIKANPLLGVTITEQYLSEVVAQAKAIPGQLNGILRLHFCVWTDAETAWMARSTLEPLLAEFEPKAGGAVWLGLDLSQNRDLTALAAVQRNGEKDGKPCFDAWVEVWTPGDTLSARVLRDKQPYDLWVADGFLNAPAGENISFRHVAQALAEMASDYRVEAVAYDRYAFRRFEEEVAELGLDLTFVEHPQGGTKRARPVDGSVEGLWMPGSLRHLEELILEGRIRLKHNPVLISAMMSAVTETDRWDNKWLSKQRAINKIDAAVALCMAVGAAMAGDTFGSIDDWLKSLA